MMQILQKLDISQYEFEEFCEKWAFVLHERTISGKFNGDYDEFWKDFLSINPDNWMKYRYVTSLGDKVIFEPSSQNKFEEFWQFKVG